MLRQKFIQDVLNEILINVNKKPGYSLVTAINCKPDMIKTSLYNTNLPYSYQNDQRSPGKTTLKVISPEIYSYVRGHVNS